jgi:hypothetical protein
MVPSEKPACTSPPAACTEAAPCTVNPSGGSRRWCHLQAPVRASTEKTVSFRLAMKMAPSASAGRVPSGSLAS